MGDRLGTPGAISMGSDSEAAWRGLVNPTHWWLSSRGVRLWVQQTLVRWDQQKNNL